MANRSYNYDPSQIKFQGRDRMRFELGDTMVEGGPETSALTDEEIDAALEVWPSSWKRAKLFLLESLCRRFAYEVDTKTGPLTLELQERAKLWRKDYEALKKDVETECAAIPASMLNAYEKPPYFYTGMQENSRACRPGKGHP